MSAFWTLATFLTALLIIYVFAPSLWISLMAADDILDAHESGLARVALRNPVRETGPPACMAKLIMLRHKMHQSNSRKRRTSPHVRQAQRSYVPQPPVSSKVSWARFGKQVGKQYH